MTRHLGRCLAFAAAGLTAPVDSLSGGVEQVSASRTLSSHSWSDGYPVESVDLAYTEFGPWSASGMQAEQVSELSPTLISATLSASSFGGEAGGPDGEGETDLTYAFTLDSPMLAAWNCTLATMVNVGGPTGDTEAGLLLKDPSGPTILGQRLRFWASDYSATRHLDGFLTIGPGSYSVEAFARPEETGRSEHASASADGVIHLIDFHTLEPVFLGYLALEGPAVIDTIGSDFDTVLALYDSAGNLLAQNDDHGGMQSQVTPDLEPGWCLAVVGGTGAGFADGFGFTPGSASGGVRLAINEHPAPHRSIDAGELQMYAFGVGHAPQAVDLGVAGPAGEVAIEVSATDLTGDAVMGLLTLWDAYGTPLTSVWFDDIDPGLLPVTLEPGVYHLTVGTDGLGYAPGFEPVISCHDCGDMCCGLIGFAGTVGGVPLTGQAGIGVDLSAHPVYFRFEIAGAPACNPADLAEPFGLLDLADVTAFATAFVAGDPAVDLDGSGLLDLADVVAFVEAFLAGCP
jgi:hypothetical protein